MLRSLNFTGRKRITQDCVNILLYERENGWLAFDADLYLSKHTFPPKAKVFVEANFKATFMRFDWGSVDNLLAPENRYLSKIEQPHLARFKVKVVEPRSDGFGRLLAIADQIRPKDQNSSIKRRTSLFRVSHTKSLEDELWRLDFDDYGPILELNINSGIQEVVKEGLFMGLLFPEIIRQILVRILKDGISDPNEDKDAWQCQWLHFALRFYKKQAPIADDPLTAEQLEWVNEVVSAFSRKNKLVDGFRKDLSERG